MFSSNPLFTTSVQSLGKGSLWMVEPSYRPCLIQALQKTPYTKGYSKKTTVNTSSSSSSPTGGQTCLEAVKDERSEDEMSTVSDVDAATAMLVLKHGPHVRIVHDRGSDDNKNRLINKLSRDVLNIQIHRNNNTVFVNTIGQ